MAAEDSDPRFVYLWPGNAQTLVDRTTKHFVSTMLANWSSQETKRPQSFLVNDYYKKGITWFESETVDKHLFQGIPYIFKGMRPAQFMSKEHLVQTIWAFLSEAGLMNRNTAHLQSENFDPSLRGYIAPAEALMATQALDNEIALLRQEAASWSSFRVASAVDDVRRIRAPSKRPRSPVPRAGQPERPVLFEEREALPDFYGDMEETISALTALAERLE